MHAIYVPAAVIVGAAVLHLRPLARRSADNASGAPR
jgi:hypothetical protein